MVTAINEIPKQTPTEDENEKLQRQRVEAVEAALKSPVSAGLSEQAEKVRRNLLVFSLVSVAGVLWDVGLKTDASIFGFTFDGLTPDKILAGLALITGFSFVHFIWLSWDSFLEWRLRITGTRLAFVTVGRTSSEDADYPDDPRQSTLHYWWAERARITGDMSGKLSAMKPQLAEMVDRINAIQTDQIPYLAGIQGGISGLTHIVGRLQNDLAALSATFASQRPSVSLKRFDNWFSLFLRSQNLRWLLLDVGMPVLLASYALVLLLTKMWL